MIPVYKPYLTPQSLSYAHQALDSGWLSHGPWLEKTTEKLKEILDVKHLLLVNNGTSANHLIAKAIQHRYPYSRHIICQDNVYIAAINSWLFDNTKLDITILPPNLKTWNSDYSSLAQWEEIFYPPVFMAIHNLGNIINVPELQKKYPKIVFCEDNCEGLFGKYNGQYSGTASFASSVSFFGNKNITCGEGGAVVLSDADSYEYVKCLHGQGQSPTRFLHSEIGYNYRMTNIQAAILYGQLENLSEILEKKAQIFERYRKFVAQHSEFLWIQESEENTEPSNWMFGLRLRYHDLKKDYFPEMEKFFMERGIEIRPMFYPLLQQPGLLKEHHSKQWWINYPSDQTVSEILHNHCAILPSYPGLTVEEQDFILKTLEEWLVEAKERKYL